MELYCLRSVPEYEAVMLTEFSVLGQCRISNKQSKGMRHERFTVTGLKKWKATLKTMSAVSL
jgi:hypothetical protein